MQYIHRDGATYLAVKPTDALMRSNLIADVVRRGDIFAVDMSTGKLTILQNDGKLAASKEQTFILVLPNSSPWEYTSYAELFIALSRALLKYKKITVRHLIGGEEVAAVTRSRHDSGEEFIHRVKTMLEANPIPH